MSLHDQHPIRGNRSARSRRLRFSFFHPTCQRTEASASQPNQKDRTTHPQALHPGQQPNPLRISQQSDTLQRPAPGSAAPSVTRLIRATPHNVNCQCGLFRRRGVDRSESAILFKRLSAIHRSNGPGHRAVTRRRPGGIVWRERRAVAFPGGEPPARGAKGPLRRCRRPIVDMV